MDWVRQVEGFTPDNTDPGEPPQWEREDLAETHSYEQWRQVWIARGLCPVDKTELDKGFCNCCGWTAAAERQPAPTPIAPTNRPFPSLDEYAEANVDDEAA